MSMGAADRTAGFPCVLSGSPRLDSRKEREEGDTDPYHHPA